MLHSLTSHLTHFLTPERIMPLIRALAFLVLGLPLSRLVGAWLARHISRRFGPEHAPLARRFGSWGLSMMAIAAALQELGFQIGVLLGAAGVLTVAVGFAAQTTLSNVISGLFLMGEAPFALGDEIEVDGVVGEVLSIDILSTKIRTPENDYVRIPNELVLKTKLKNLTRFEASRLQIDFAVPRTANLDELRTQLRELLALEPSCAASPQPELHLKTIGAALDVSLIVWTTAPQSREAKAAIMKRSLELLTGLDARRA